MKIDLCELAVDLMTAAVEGTLSGESRSFLEEHRKTCPACSKLYDTLREQNARDRQDCGETAYQKLRWKMIGLPLVIAIGGLGLLVIILFIVMTSGIF
ncbi:MAG: zf-HC2 domain-containing protein [Oscillospiraceae bacterium]|nr:zf-HC2 domain-containing protein [Oscillospiraceae bacterium]